MKINIDGQKISIADLRAAWQSPATLTIGKNAARNIAESNALIASVLASGEQVYGVNTGFGQLAQVRVSNDELAHLQENLVRSHAVGVGEDLPDDCVRLVMILKAIALARGSSGVRLTLVNGLCDLVNNEIYPCIPCKGSVGASGDLAPLDDEVERTAHAAALRTAR